MKKILFILHMPPPVHGSSVVGQYVKESKLINEAFACRYINLGTSRSIDEIGKNPLPKISRYFNILVQVLKELIYYKPDLCYLAISAKGWAFYKDGLVAFLVKLMRVPLVFHFHNKGVESKQENVFDDFLYNTVFRNSHAILLSSFLYRDVRKYIPASRVHYCPNGLPDFGQDKKKWISKEVGDVEILFLSNLIKSKGVFVLLEACSLLKKKGISFKCVFVGGEGDITAHRFRKRVYDLGLNEDVRYEGKKYGLGKNEILSKADIFVFPTFYHNETFGLVNLEAMQHSLPVVSTFEGGIPDVVEDGVTGFLVPQNDVVALSEKIEELIVKPLLREKMGHAGREKYKKEFTLNLFEMRLKEILIEILDTPC